MSVGTWVGRLEREDFTAACRAQWALARLRIRGD